jgi:hypothetical protein
VNADDGNLLFKPIKLPFHLCGKLFANARTVATHTSTCSIEDLAVLPFFNETNSALITVPPSTTSSSSRTSSQAT